MLCYKMTISHNLVTNVSAWFFWNMVNFVDFSVIHVSQGSVATYVRCGGISAQRCTASFLLSLSVKEFLKSFLRFDKVTAQSSVASFFGTQCIHAVFSARQHAERAICYRPSVRLSVCLSVRPSHGWISRKRLKLGSCKFHHTVAPSL